MRPALSFCLLFQGLYISLLCISLSGLGCKQQPAPVAEAPAVPLSPDKVFGPLFEAVQMERVFPDSKTFADCRPKNAPEVVMQRYSAEKDKPGFSLQQFVLTEFYLPPPADTSFHTDMIQSVDEHIRTLWPVLTRRADTAVSGYSTLLPLPYPYVVPGGRFREVYYWDSYFTMLGLKASGRRDLIENMLNNFSYLIDTYGHIPNGNRSYYLGRSQPPFFSLMVMLLNELDNPGDSAGPVVQHYLPAMEKEYQFWMDGADRLSAAQPAYRRVVRLPDGTVLNRYWDDFAGPRPEAYREDVETARASGRPVEEIYTHLRAAAESGWDFSKRWLADDELKSIHTTDFAPVDLNCLIWHLEIVLARTYKQTGQADRADALYAKAAARQKAINTYFYNASRNFYFDYDVKAGRMSDVVSAAGIYPLFFKLADSEQAAACTRTMEQELLGPGGLAATPAKTGQQWDNPNGWAPLQWMAMAGLRNYKQDIQANIIRDRWIKLNTDVYKRTGKMMEKYNVEDLSLDAGGGEYPVQDGFGWTNGVLLKFLEDKTSSLKN